MRPSSKEDQLAELEARKQAILGGMAEPAEYPGGGGPPARYSAPGSPSAPETTTLDPEEESRFRQWAQSRGIQDVDHADSHYDYRGYWKQNPSAQHQQGQHFTDQFKQHGHPTFSEESQYSKGRGDGGTWQGESFTPSQYPEQGEQSARIAELEKRLKALQGY